MSFQLELFRSPEECEMSDMRFQIDKIRASSDKVRKKLFAENGKHIKDIEDLKQRLEIIERGLCHGTQEIKC